jgi:hypothetical protein
MKIDAYTHFTPTKYLDFVEKEEGKPYPLRHLLEHIPTIVDVKARLDLLDRNQARPGAGTLDRIFSAHCR